MRIWNMLGGMPVAAGLGTAVIAVFLGAGTVLIPPRHTRFAEFGSAVTAGPFLVRMADLPTNSYVFQFSRHTTKL